MPVLTNGYLEEYGPFPPTDRPTLFPLRSCSIVEDSGPQLGQDRRIRAYAETPNSGKRVRAILQSELGGFAVDITNSQGQTLAGPVLINDYCPLSRPDVALVGDLNDDSTDDFVLSLASCGNGLAAYIYDLVVALSDHASYRFWVIETFEPNDHEFCLLGDPPLPTLIKTSFVYGFAGDSEKDRNYWVYDLIGFDGPRPVMANHRDARFPKWVWFTFVGNHKPVRTLSEAQKSLLLQQARRELFREATSRPLTETSVGRGPGAV